MNRETRFYINFDLDTKKLRAFFPDNENYTNAYNQIRSFLLKNGFEHNQGSGYVSKFKMSITKVSTIILELSKTYTWFHNCCRDCRGTIVYEKQFNFQNYIEKPYKKQNKKIITKTPKPKLVPKTKDPKNKTNNLSR